MRSACRGFLPRGGPGRAAPLTHLIDGSGLEAQLGARDAGGCGRSHGAQRCLAVGAHAPVGHLAPTTCRFTTHQTEGPRQRNSAS